MRGAIAAMAMTGMRAFTVSLGLVDQAPPQAIFERGTSKLRGLIPRRKRRAGIEIAHWSYGALGGAAFGVLPESLRRQVWAGPAYGLLTLVGFEAAIAPALGLKQAKETRLVERSMLVLDHLLYGFVLAELGRRPRG